MTISQALFSFEGRMSRRDFWLKNAIIVYPLVICIVTFLFLFDIFGIEMSAILMISAIYWLGLPALVKRLHDRDYSGWWATVGLFPPAMIWIWIEVWFFEGTIGPNKFGEDSGLGTTTLQCKRCQAYFQPLPIYDATTYMSCPECESLVIRQSIQVSN